MKQTVITAYVFNPSVNQINLSTIQGFTVERLYAIINITRNQLIYAVGQPTYGFVAVVGGVLTLAYNTSAMSDSDLLEIIYDTENTDLSNAGVTLLTDGTNVASLTGAGEFKVSVTESLPAGSANIGSLTNITGTISLPTNAAQESGGHLASIDSKLTDDGSGNLKVNLETPIPAGSNTIGGVTQSGSWTVNLASGSIDIGKVDQGLPNTLANGWPVIPTDGTHQITIKAASTAASVSDTSEVVALSPNTPLPAGSNILGAVTQSGGPWTQNVTEFGGAAVVTGVGASGAGIPRVTVSNDSNILATQSGSWTVQQGGAPWSVSQSGTWNITNITGTVSLPTGAATSALQTTISGTLTVIEANQTNGTQETQLVDAGGHLGTIKASGIAALTTDTSLVVALSPNSPLPAGTNILGSVSQNGTWTVQQGGAPWSVSQSGTWNINNVSGTISLPTGASTSALQTTGNTSLASILANQTNGTQETQVTNFPSIQAVSQSGSWTVSLTSESIEIGKVDQGNPGTNANAWWVQVGDTTHGPVAVKAASTAAAAGDASFVVALSPNSPLPAGSNILGAVTQSGTWNIGTVTTVTTVAAVTAITNALPAGSNVIGAVTQSGAWTTGRTWDLASGSDSVSAVQSGAWNITNITGTISLPTGASTSALQTTGNTSLASILANQTNGTQTVAQAGTWTVQQGSAPWSMNLSQVGGVAFALGQAAAAACLPVVTQADASPATQSITIVDSGSTITAQANSQNAITGSPTAGSVATFTLASWNSVDVQVTGTWTGTLETEVSIDGGTTWFTHGVKQTGASYQASSFTANFTGYCNTGGKTNFRVRAIAAVTGTAVVKVTESVNVNAIIVSNSLTLRDSTTQSISNTIKAASTAALATDTSIVVALSPNSPLPAGSAVIGAVTQSGSWTTGRTWTLTSGTDSVAAVQSGTWNIGTVTAVTAITNALPAGANVIGAVTQSGGPWTNNITQFGGSAIVTGTGASGAGIPRVTVSNDTNILATQSGTWTVQQGSAPWSQNLTQIAGNAVSTAASGVQKVGIVGNAGAAFDAVQGAAAPANVLASGGVHNTTLPTIGNGDISALQLDARGTTITSSEAATGTAVPTNASAMGGSDGTNLQPIGATLKGTQGTYGVTTQNMKDSGRTYVVITLDRVTGVTSEALATMTINKGGTVTTATEYTVTTGKTLRIQSMASTMIMTATIALFGRVRLRSAATVSATSGIIINQDIPNPAAVAGGASAAGAGYNLLQDIPDGLEIAGGQQIGISQIMSSTSSTVSVSLICYEY